VARARENTKDYTNALAGYASVTASTATGVAARAQLRIGHCLMALKKFADAAKAFLAVPYTYNYPEYNAEAWYQSGLAYAAAKQPAEAAKSLGQVIKEHPKSKWAEEAKKQLPAIKEQLAALKNAKKKT